MVTQKEFHLIPLLERCPVAADHAIKGNDRLEDATIVVRPMTIVWRENDVTTLVTDKVLVVRRNEMVTVLAESSRTAIVSDVKNPALEFTALPPHHVNGIAHHCDAPTAVADIEPRPPHEVLECSGLAAIEILARQQQQSLIPVKTSLRSHLNAHE